MIWILRDLNGLNRTCWWLEVSGIAFLQHHGKHHQASPHVRGFAPNCVMQCGGLWQQLALNRPSRSADVSCTTWFLLQSWFKQGKLLTFKAACPGSCPTSWHSVQEHGLGASWCHPFSIHLHPKLLILWISSQASSATPCSSDASLLEANKNEPLLRHLLEANNYHAMKE